MKYDYIECGDCLELMKGIPDKSIDLIVTDPPYGINYQSNLRVKSDKFDVLKNDDNDLRFLAYQELERVLKPDCVCIVFASWKNYNKDFSELDKLFDIKNVIVWWKHGGGIGDLKHTLITDYELAIVCHKGRCKIRGKRDGSVWECNKVAPSKMVHPTQKPLEIIQRLIDKFSDKNDIVLDPFLGSGTTAVACLNTDRHYIGFELDPQYYDIACKRLGDVVMHHRKEVNIK